MHPFMPVLALVAAYLIGGIPFGYLVVRWKTGADVRAAGSGNIGAPTFCAPPAAPQELLRCSSMSPKAGSPSGSRTK